MSAEYPLIPGLIKTGIENTPLSFTAHKAVRGADCLASEVLQEVGIGLLGDPRVFVVVGGSTGNVAGSDRMAIDARL